MSLIVFLAALIGLCHAANPFPSRSYKTEDFLTPKFKTKTPGKGATAPGYLFIGFVGAQNTGLGGPIIVKNNGDLIWQGPRKYPSYYNFQTQQLNGKSYLTWWNGALEHTGHGYGNVVLMDNTYTVTKTICFPASVNIVPPRPSDFPGDNPNPCYIDKHESFITDRNSIIVTAYNATQTDLRALGGPKNGWVYDCLFYELSLDDNSVLFSWSALDHVPVTKSHFVNSTGNDPLYIRNLGIVGNDRSNPWDYFHINSVQPVDGGYLANSRMTWSFYMVSDQDGSLDWTLEGSHGGDFKMQDDIFFSWQHHPRLESKQGKNLNIHFFNNDNINTIAKGKNVSTGYMLKVNPATKKVSTIFNLHKQPFQPLYAQAEGSQQDLPNGHHLIGYGTKAFIEEYDGQNKLIYASQFADPRTSTHTYRTYRFPWTGMPSESPKVVAIRDQDDNVLVYMSWNGATDYTQWMVSAGETPELLLKTDNVTKKGFETQYVLEKGLLNDNFVQVKALSGDGTVQGQSDTVAVSDG